jgi:RHS repeat-associated protein
VVVSTASFFLYQGPDHTPEPASALVPLAALLITTHRVISYTYPLTSLRTGDSLYRLTGEEYRSTGLTTGLLSDGLRSYTYDHANWLTQVVSGTLTTDYTFTGQRNEAGLGLMHYGARFYSPRLGRFVSADTVVPNPGNPQDLNRYSYVLGNPVRYTDPSGHYIFEDDPSEPYLPPPPPKPPIEKVWPVPIKGCEAYDPRQASRQAWGLVKDWFFGTGDEVQYFGPENSLTHDIIYDPGMDAFRTAWAKEGHPLPWTWEHTADERESGWLPTRLAKGSVKMVREHVVELGFSTFNLGSARAEGRIDPVGGTIGSLDRIKVLDAGDDLVLFMVYNEMGWASGTRFYGTNFSLLPDVPRGLGLPGGTIYQHFYWWEFMPNQEE